MSPFLPVAELIFDKYELHTRLAVGGMGEVFSAVQRSGPGSERPAILKRLLPELAAQEGFIEQFLDEARLAATLNHPNVVSIYEVGQWGGAYFIAMEYIQGRNISQLINASLRQHQPVPPVVIAQVLRDAALGVAHAHRALGRDGRPLNLVHRDISPQNIMVRDDGVTKVVDFGIARASNRSTDAVKGRLAYLAPEQLRGEPVTGATDQFALGVVLWEMACGRRLFQSDHELDLLKKVLESKVPPPSTLVPGLPVQFDAMTLRMLARDPQRRYASCAEVAQAFGQFLAGQSSESGPVARYLRELGPVDGAVSIQAAAARGSLVKQAAFPRARVNSEARPKVNESSPPASSASKGRPVWSGLLVGLLAMGVGAGAVVGVRWGTAVPVAAARSTSDPGRAGAVDAERKRQEPIVGPAPNAGTGAERSLQAGSSTGAVLDEPALGRMLPNPVMGASTGAAMAAERTAPVGIAPAAALKSKE